MDLEGHGQSALATASSNFSEESAESSGRVRRWTGSRCFVAAERSDHLKVQIILCIGSARPGEIAELRKNSNKIVGFQAFRRQAHIRSELVDQEIAAGLDSREGGNRGHFRTEIKIRQLSVEQADVARNNELVRRTRDIQIGTQCSGYK